MERWKRWKNDRARKRAVNEAEDFIRGKVSIRSITTLSVDLGKNRNVRFDLKGMKYGTSEDYWIVKGELVDNEGNKRRWEVDFEGGKLDAFSIDQAPVKSGST